MEITVITSNLHKFEEFHTFFSKTNFKVKHVMQKYPELQADSLEDIALQAASNIQTTRDDQFILEDSGLFVDCLGGFPGPYSSYVFQTISWEGILKLLHQIPFDMRTASFRSVIAFRDKNEIKLFTGKCFGYIKFNGIGGEGFGYDPIFVPINQMIAGKELSEDNIENAKSFAQMTTKVKNELSHRSNSMKLLAQYLNVHLDN